MRNREGYRAVLVSHGTLSVEEAAACAFVFGFFPPQFTYLPIIVLRVVFFSLLASTCVFRGGKELRKLGL